MKKSLIILIPIIFFGCAPTAMVKYTPPSPPKKPKFSAVINSGFDITWEAIINHVSSTFFAIEDFEKASGLIIVTFGSNNPDPFINCGIHHVKVTKNFQTRKYNGPYENFVIRIMNGTFTGRMNITARKLSEEKTKVRVNAKYVLVNSKGKVWNFESGSSATQKMFNTVAKNKIRTCYPTYKAEKSILKAVRKLAE